MNKLEIAKKAMADFLGVPYAEKQKFESVSTDQGLLEYDGELNVGTEVFVLDEEGERVPAPDADYLTESRVVKVEGGIVTSIDEAVIEEEMQEEVPTVAEVASVSVDDFNALVAKVEQLKEIVNQVIGAVDEVKTDVGEVSEAFSKAVKTPQEDKVDKVKVDSPTQRESELSKYLK